MEDAKFLVGQKAFIEKDGSVLVLFDPAEGLDFPGGKVQVGEQDLSESLQREVQEETGLEIEVGRPFSVWHSVFPPEHRLAGQQVYLVGFRCRYKSGDIKLSEEHNNFKWVNKDNFREVNDGTSFFKVLGEYFAMPL